MTKRLWILMLLSVAAMAQTPAQFVGLLTNATDYTATWNTWYINNGAGVPGTFAGPAYGGSLTDPIFGTTANRAPFLSDCGAPSTYGCPTNGMITDYSKVVLWSADNKYFIIAEPAGWLHLYDATTTPYTHIRRIQVNNVGVDASDGADIYGDEANWTWSRTPGTHLLYYTGGIAVGGNKVALKVYDPTLDTGPGSTPGSVVHDFSATIALYSNCIGINNEREGESSDDDNVFAFTCNISGGASYDNDQNAIIVYHKSTDSVVSKPYAAGTGSFCYYTPTQGCSLAYTGGVVSGFGGANYPTISPKGDYLLVNWNGGYQGAQTTANMCTGHDGTFIKGCGTEVFNATTLAYLGGATSSNNHGDVGYDVAGKEVFVQNADAYATNYQYHMFEVCKLSTVTNNGIVGSTAAGGCQHFFRMPSTYTWANGETISMRATQGAGMGYMLLSGYDSADNYHGTNFSLENDALKIDWANLTADNTSDQVAGSPNTYYRLGRTHSLDSAAGSYGGGDYFAQADGSPDNTFSKFAYSSSMDAINVSTSTNYTTNAELPVPAQGRYGAFYTLLPIAALPSGHLLFNGTFVMAGSSVSH